MSFAIKKHNLQILIEGKSKHNILGSVFQILEWVE